MVEAAKAPKQGIGRTILIAVGLVLLATLPFVPWLSRGLSQSGVEKAVKDAGGLASYGRYLEDTGTYFLQPKFEGKKWIRNTFGDAFVAKLTYVELRNQLDDKSVIVRLPKLPDLEILNAARVNIDDQDAIAIGKCEGLKMLSLDNSQITSTGVSALADLPELVSLNLEGTVVDDDALDVIAGYRRLKRLYLGRTQVTDAGVAKLTELTNLLGIGLESTKVTDAAVVDIVRLLELTEVRLSDTSVSGEGVVQLAELSKLQALYLNDNKNLTTSDLSWLANCKDLEILDLAGTGVTDGIIAVLPKMPKLVSVSLRATNVSLQAINELREKLGRGVTVQSDFSELAR